jgi:nucleoid-associated protein YgaU
MSPDEPGSRDDEMPDFSGVTGGASTSATDAAGAPVEAEVYTPAQSEEIYEVKPGDSLSKIAKHHYGDAHQWRRIFEANTDRIKDPDLIQPGWKLKIPAKPPAKTE